MNFIIVGLGYISDKHLSAIRSINGNLLCAYDPHCQAGKLDNYFPDCKYFNDLVLFDEFIYKCGKIDYAVICSPNFTHAWWVRHLLKSADNIICEKPIAICKDDYLSLCHMSANIYPVLQLRNNPEIIELKKSIKTDGNYPCVIEYHTRRGDWYNSSWQTDEIKSGGIKYNIGIHIFDTLCYLFGQPVTATSTYNTKTKYSCIIGWDNASASVSLSTESYRGQRSYRHISIDNQTIDLTAGFTDFHTPTYQKIIAGDWIKAQDIRDTYTLMEMLR